MAESGLHLFLKSSVAEALKKNGFQVYEEPEWPPLDHVSWREYRPDLFGVKNCNEVDEYVFVECETKPSLGRIIGKKTNSIIVQSKLLRHIMKRMILAIPSNTLRTLDLGVRRYWEIWMIDTWSGKINSIQCVG